MEKNSIAIFNSNDELPTNGDASFIVLNKMQICYWLTGIEQEDTMVILFPDNPDPKYREVLVLVRPNELKEKWDGHRLSANEATAFPELKRSSGWMQLMVCCSHGFIWLILFI